MAPDAPSLNHLGLRQREIHEALGPRYEILSFVGAGASALVFKVADLAADGEIKAAKVNRLTRADPRTDPTEALRAEFTLAARFAHPNLVRYHDLDIPPDGRLCVTTMEFVEGAPLAAGVTKKDLRVTCEFMVQLLRGLQFLHDCGFVHGDVKPSNVLCAEGAGRRQVKLLDYHLAFRLTEAARTSPRGTLRYMPPEVIGGERADSRSDLYSAGVVFYEALTGSPLFEGSATEIARQHLAAPIPGLEGDMGLATVLHRLLAKRPEGRYESAAEAIVATAEAVEAGWLPETCETMLGRVRSAPLTGREEAVADFMAFADPPAGSQTPARAFLIQGRPGLGKTRLLRECEVQAQAHGFKTLLIPAEGSADKLLDTIERGLGLAAPGERTHGEGSRADGATDLWETLARPSAQASGTGVAAGPPALMSRSDGLAERLLQLGSSRKVALFFDDLDAASQDALDCVLFLMRGTGAGQVRYCLALSEAAELRQALRTFLETWRVQRLVREIHLDELGPDLRSSLVRGMLPRPTPAAVVSQLVESSGGSPEVIVTTVEHLVSKGDLAVAADGRVVAAEGLAFSMSDGLRQAGAHVLASVGKDARKALELLAVANDEVDLAALAGAAGLDAPRLASLVQAEPVSGILSLRRTARGMLCKLQHRGLADLLLESVPARRLRALHDKLADGLERSRTLPSGPTALSAVRHRLQGKSPAKGVELALMVLGSQGAEGSQEGYLDVANLALRHAKGQDRTSLLETAGDLNSARGAFAEAASLFRRALRTRSLGLHVRMRLLRKLGMACAGAGDYARARRSLGKVINAACASDRAHMAEVGHARLALGRANLYESKIGPALKNCELAAAIGKELGDERLVASTLFWMGEARLERAEIKDSREAFLQALRKFRKVGDSMGIGAALAGLGYVEMVRQNWRRSVRCLEEALRHLRASGYLTEAAGALTNLGSVHQKLCAWDRATEDYGAALALYERLGYARGQCAALLNLSQVNASRGRLEEAIGQAQQALEIVPRDPGLRCYALTRMARAQYALGDFSAAREASQSAAEMARALELPVALESALRTLGEIDALQRQLGSAEQYLRSALALSERRGSAERQAVCLMRLAEVAILSGDLASAFLLAESADTKAKPLRHDMLRALTHSVRGKVLVAQRRPDEAIADLLKAEEFLSAARAWEGLAEVSLQLAKAYLRQGKLRFAALHCRTALDTVEQVAGRLQREEHRISFLSDPRRAELYEVANVLRRAAERPKNDFSPADEDDDRQGTT
jgi:tetratricopeptide (TPR) repeat protein